MIFMPDAKEMVGVFYHIMHIFRGLVGLLVVRKLPTLSAMVEDIPATSTEKVPFDKICKFLEQGASQSAEKFEKAAGSFLKIYFLLTIICIILDLCAFFSGVGKYGQVDESVYAGVAIIVLAFVFLALDFYFFLWVISVRMKLPLNARSFVLWALLGFASKMTKALNEKIGKI